MEGVSVDIPLRYHGHRLLFLSQEQIDSHNNWLFVMRVLPTTPSLPATFLSNIHPFTAFCVFCRNPHRFTDIFVLFWVIVIVTSSLECASGETFNTKEPCQASCHVTI